MIKGHSHLSDERLIETCLFEGALAPADAVCQSCAARRGELIALLDEVTQASEDAVDAAFPAERLARQQARILQRVKHEGRPARLLSFPATSADAGDQRPRPAVRWIAAAAAAGLVIGMVAGHLVDEFPRQMFGPAVMADRTTPASGTPLRTVAHTVSDEEFLGQIELAVEGPAGSALGLLHQATPRAWEIE